MFGSAVVAHVVAGAEVEVPIAQIAARDEALFRAGVDVGRDRCPRVQSKQDRMAAAHGVGPEV